VTGELSKLADIAAFGGINRADLAPFLRNLLQIRGRGTGRADMADINELKDRVPAISRILAAGFGGKDTPESALKRAQGLTGRQLYETILKGSEALAKGAAAARALRDPMAALENLFDNLRMVMEPTGQILITMLTPVIRFAEWLVKILKGINELTGGFVGLYLVIGGAVWLATRTATVALWDFVRSLLGTAGAARAAAVGTTVSGVAGAGGAAVGGAAAGAGVMATVRSLLPRIIATVGYAYVAYEVAKQFVDPKRGFRGEAGEFNKEMDRIKKYLDPKTRGAEDPQTRELKQVNRNLEEMKGRTIGAGKRTAAGISNFEAEYAISKAFGLA
jgi:hypothetical protein